MKLRVLFFTAMFFVAISGVFYACSKQATTGPKGTTSSAGQQAVAFYLTDGPGFFDSVYINISTVEVVVDTCSRNDFSSYDTTTCAIRDTVNFNAGVYNLTGLRNGIDTALASGNIAQGTIKRIIITLGAGNYVVKDGVNYPLNMLPGVDTRIVIKLLGNEFQTGDDHIGRLWLDFDVERSIIQVHGGQFYLSPVIRFFSIAKTASVSGQVLPWAAWPVISVYSGQDSLYALPNWDGKFMVRGLQPGKYSVFINSANGYSDTTINNVNVSMGQNTDIGTIVLHK